MSYSTVELIASLNAQVADLRAQVQAAEEDANRLADEVEHHHDEHCNCVEEATSDCCALVALWQHRDSRRQPAR